MSRLVISHSQAESFNQCEYKFVYATLEKLEPVDQSQALLRGSNGHAFFEAFFQGIKAGLDVGESQLAGFNAMKDHDKGMMVLNMPAMMKWVRDKWTDNREYVWEIIDCETTQRLNIGPEFQFPYTYDLIIRDKNTGKIYMVDHKFLGQFYTPKVMDLMPQMPKYIAAIEASKGIKIDGAIYNMVSTKTNAVELFRTYKFEVSDARKSNAMKEQVITMKAIKELVNGDREPVRTANKMNCGYCSFSTICEAAINGRDKEVVGIKKMLFKTNTYGYEEE